MKLTEQDIRRWQANLSSEVNEMMSELLNSLLSRHQYLSSEYFDACRERDKVLQGLYRIDKDLKSVNKQISRGDSDRKVLSEAILNIAKELGIIIAELHRISAQLIAARKTTMTVDELVSGFIEEVRSSKQKWIQSSENIDATYSEMDG
jgi:septal ring factor EnvC (AmiA/AmiB activator)